MEQPPIERLEEWPFIVTIVITSVVLFVYQQADGLRKRDFLYVPLLGAVLYGLQTLLGTDRFVFILAWAGSFFFISHLTTPNPHPITRLEDNLKKYGEGAVLVSELSEAREKMGSEKKDTQP